MHYLFLTTGTWDGNASFVRLREFGAEMSKRDVTVSFLVDDLPFNRNLSLPGQTHFTPKGGLIAQTFSRRKILRALAPDFVHVLNPYVKACLSLAFSRRQVVGDWDEWPARRAHPFPKNLIEKFLDHWLRNRARVIVVASKYLQQQFKSQFDLDAVYIPYATYLQEREDGASPFAEPTAVYVGNFYAAYDHDLIFDAGKILKSRGKSFRIAMLGGGPDLEKWRSFTRENGLAGSIALPGFVSGPDLWRHLRHAHVLLFPIKGTLLNRVRCPSKTFAYAQSKRPVIANRVGEIDAVLGEKAMYIEPTAQAFADAIAAAMSAPRASDIDYAIEQQNWSARTDVLMDALARLSRGG